MSFHGYPHYREVEHAWLARLPRHWRLEAVKRHARIATGATPSSTNSEFWDGGIAWATPVDLTAYRGGVLRSTARTISESGMLSCATEVVPVGAVLLSTRAPIGTVAVAGISTCVNQGCRALVPKASMMSDYLAKTLGAWAEQLQTLGKGSTFLELSTDSLADLKVPVPPLVEQTAVSAFLSRETARIDALVENQERLMALLQEKRQAAIATAVTKGLDPNVRMKDSGVRWIGRIPEHWSVVGGRRLFSQREERARVDDVQLTASQKHGIIPQSRYAELEGMQVMQVIKGADILKHVEPGDFVISMRSFQGGLEFSRERGCVSSAYVALIPGKEAVSSYFAHVFKSAGYIQALQSTSNLVRDGQALRYTNFAQVALPLPPKNEQAQIAEFLDSRLDRIEALRSECHRAVALLSERRTALITAAVTGQIDVRGLVETAA